MAYNKLKILGNNIEALSIALQYRPGGWVSPQEQATLGEYAGFGGIKAILYPDAPKEEWAKLGATSQDMRLYEPVIAFHTMLKNLLGEEEYSRAIDALKHSVLTAFYTPPIVPAILYETMAAAGIRPERLYEPSSGAGVFITEAAQVFPGLKQVTAVEKDLLTSRVLKALASTLELPVEVLHSGFEDTRAAGNGLYDVIASNIPFGSFRVYDPDFPDEAISGKIHNYFFAKGLDKLREGGLLAFITSDGFLNSPSNREAREYLFRHADFISVAVMPDNLIKENGNTESPSHLLLVQKNSRKLGLSEEEAILLDTVGRENSFGPYTTNAYIDAHPELLLGDDIRPGKNQYGLGHQVVWQKGPIEAIGPGLNNILVDGFTNRFDLSLFEQFRPVAERPRHENLPKLSLTDPPADRRASSSMQMGLFDVAPAEAMGRAQAYVSDMDATVVARETARIISTVRTADRPEHELAVLVAGKEGKRYLYKLYANAREIDMLGADWMSPGALALELEYLSRRLREFGHDYIYEGDKSLEPAFALRNSTPSLFTPLKPFYKDGALVIRDGRPGLLSDVDKENDQAMFRAMDIGDKEYAFYQQYVQVRDRYIELFTLESREGVEQPGLRLDLNAMYDEFTGAHGTLNLGSNARLIREDKAFGDMILSSLERKEGASFVKADFLLAALVASKEPFKTENPAEALAVSLNDTGRVDIPFIAAALRKDESESIQLLGDLVYLNPANGEWQTADLYLSGNVVTKLAEAESAAAGNPENTQYARSLQAIRSVQPEPIPFELLDFNLGERWIPLDYYNRFASYLFETTASVTYLPSIDVFRIQAKSNAKIEEEFAVTPKSERKMYGDTLLEHAMENTTPFFTYKVESPGGVEIRRPDNEATQLAHQKIESIRSKFTEWMQGLPQDEKNGITALYNNTFNCYVLRTYNGDHLTFPGLDRERAGITDLYPSQKSAAWRIVQNRGALIDHEVGLGKTLTMIVSAMEMKRLGIVRKPAILAMKSNVSQIVDQFRKAYPRAKILAPTIDDFTPARRLKLFYAVKNNNWDCIILTHDQFEKIPQSLDIQERILKQEVANTKDDLNTLKDLGGDINKRMLKGLELRQNNLAVKLKAVIAAIESKKDEDIHFQDMGIDHLFVDESHKFKNLGFTTRHMRVAGLGNVDGSQKALNMLFAVRTLQEKFNADLCVTFLSGTPISNSLTEMYLIFKYLRPRELARQHLHNFDAWAANYAKKTTDFEFSVTSEIIQKERFRHFKNVPELALFYNEITDYKTAAHIELDKPVLEEILVNLKPTKEQEIFLKKLMEFARTGNGELLGRGPLTPEEDDGRMLIATNYAKKMAVDMRLVGQQYSDDPGNKVNTCARNIAAIYRESHEHKGTQVVFCDIGTPKAGEFNVYDALKNKLVADFGIPAREITFIHDWTDKNKGDLFKKMNRGAIRIAMGSTEKLGTGTNIQRRGVAEHDLDIPWRPSDLDQRGGRLGRQGNEVAKQHYGNRVKRFIYAVEKTLDNYKFNLLKNKQTFISQMKNSALHVRTIDEGAIDEKSGMNFNEYIAILSGDTRLLEKSKLERKVSALESLRGAYHREKASTQWRLGSIQKHIESLKGVITNLDTDNEHYEKRLRFENGDTKANPVTLDDITAATPELVGEYLIRLWKEFRPSNGVSEDKQIGRLYGFGLYIYSHRRFLDDNDLPTYSNEYYAARPGSTIKYTYNGGAPNIDNPKLAARHFLNAIDRVGPLLEKHRKDLTESEAEMLVLTKILEKPFEKEAELRQMKTSLQSLEREIALSLEEKKFQQDSAAIGGVTEEPEKPAQGSSLKVISHSNQEKGLTEEGSVEQFHKPMRKAR